jgi:hypothetical protein
VLNDVALLIELGVIGTLEPAVPLGRNDRLAAAFSDLGAQMIGIVALVGDCDVRGEAFDQLARDSMLILGDRRWTATGFEMTSGSG